MGDVLKKHSKLAIVEAVNSTLIAQNKVYLLLSGRGLDGAKGATMVKEKGGMVIVQTP